MAPPYVTNGLIFSLLTTEISTGNVLINRGVSQIENCSEGVFQSYVTLAASASITYTFLVSQIFQLYIKNIDPTSGIIVSLFPTGGSLNQSIALSPGDLTIPIWGTSGTGNGLEQVKLQNASNTNPVLYEIFYGF